MRLSLTERVRVFGDVGLHGASGSRLTIHCIAVVGVLAKLNRDRPKPAVLFSGVAESGAVTEVQLWP